MRKRLQFILIVLVSLCISACKNKPYPSSLIVADSLTNVKPDSAIILLENLREDMRYAPEATRMYYQLLCIKANDKAYIVHTSDSLILPVLHYYIRENSMQHLPEAYYYAGRICRDLGDAPQALDYFNKAIEAIEGDKNHSLRGYIYSQMGTLFVFQDMYDEALEIIKEAYQYDVLLKDSMGIIFDLRDMAGIYRRKENIDSSLYYYRKAYDLAHTIQHQRLMRIVQDQMASLYIQLGEYDLARTALQPSLSNLHQPSKSSVYSIASELHHRVGNIDSARYYYGELLSCGTIYAKQAAHQGLTEIAMANDNPKDALAHLQQYILCSDSIRRITNTESIRKMRALYNYQLREKENARLKAENEKKALIVFCILAIAFILLAFFFAYLQYNRRKRLLLSFKLERLQQIEKEQYRKSSEFIEENKRLIETMENKLQSAGETNNALKEQLRKQKEIIFYTNKQAEIELSERERARIILFNSDIYNLFKEQAYSDKHKITIEHWNTLEQTVNTAYQNFTENLNKLCQLSEHERRICLLIKINIPPTDMAKLTNHTKESISSTRRRLYEKVFREKGTPKQWDDFVFSL